MISTSMIPDAPVDEIREIRHCISEEKGHSPQNLVAYYIQIQAAFSLTEVNSSIRLLLPTEADKSNALTDDTTLPDALDHLMATVR